MRAALLPARNGSPRAEDLINIPELM